MEVLPLRGLMVLEGLVAFLLIALMVPVVLGGLVAFLLMALEGLVALLLVVPEALEVYILEALKDLLVHHLLMAPVVLVVPMVLVVSKVLVVLLPEALVVLMVLIPEINPLWVDFSVVLRHNNLSISLVTVLLVTTCHINITNM